MDNNGIQKITPLTNNNANTIETISFINNDKTQPENINSQETSDDFAHGLPDWDLVPPYTTVRRVNRK